MNSSRKWKSGLTMAAMVLALGFSVASEAQARGPYNATRSNVLRGLRWGPSADIVQQLERRDNFSILLAALDKAELTETLAGGGPFTLFAPTDGAFVSLLSDLDLTPQELLNSPDLANILLYHVLGEARGMGDLLTSDPAITLYADEPVLATSQRARAFINDARVLRSNVKAENGLIHIIDAVLLPPDEPITVESVVDVLRLDGRFDILLTALETAGLDDDLAGASSITLFAPTDDAFLALLGELEITAAELLANPSLGDILLYHVLGSDPGILNLLFQGSAVTEQGDPVIIGFRAGRITVNQAKIINPNVNAPNGRIQVLDSVLLP